MNRRYNRVLLKISGESLMGNDKYGLNQDAIKQICSDIKEIYEQKYQICLVVGGGNICRGATISKMGIERASGDYMGMLATVINALAMQGMLESMGITTRVQSAIPMTTIAEPYIRRKAIRHMEKNRLVIFSGGTGNPFFTTDTAASLRAAETCCDVIIKATQVDGVYSDDPNKNTSAEKYEKISYKEVLANELNVMDAAAISLAKDSKIPILIFNIHNAGNLSKVLQHEGDFSIIA